MGEVPGFYACYSEGDGLRRSRTRSLERIVAMDRVSKYLVEGGRVADIGAGEGAYALLGGEVERMAEAEWRVLVDYHLATCAERDCLGMSNHGLAIGRKAGADGGKE